MPGTASRYHAAIVERARQYRLTEMNIERVGGAYSGATLFDFGFQIFHDGDRKMKSSDFAKMFVDQSENQRALEWLVTALNLIA